jgi:RHS repeat-associated protein
LPLPEHASFDGTTGVFSFRPDGGQVGAFQVTFVASDGSLTDSETITITVPAAGTTTSFSGRVLDANSAAGGQTVPVVGATISLLGTGSSAMSGSQGLFTLTGIPSGHQVLDIATATAQPGPAGSRYGGFREAIELVGGVENVITRPFFLPRIDEASSTVVDPNATTVVTNPNLGVTLTVPPHTAKYPNGTDFTGALSISLVPDGLAPAQMPEYLGAGMVVTIQPVGVFFASPVPLDFPNIDALPTGNEMRLWSLLPTEGRFAVVGRSQISADGTRVETVAGGVRAADWHFALPPELLAASGPSPERRCGGSEGPEACMQVGSSAGLAEGALQERHSLPAVRSMGVPRTLTLAYDSTSADVRPIIGMDSTLLQLAAVPEQFSVSLEVGGFTQGATAYYDASVLPENADSTSRLVTQFDASALPTGRYEYEMDVFSRYTNSRIGSTVSDEIVVVNRRQSPVGAGWGFAGLQRLDVQADGSALIEDGTGGALVFEPAPQGTFTATGTMNVRHGDNPFAAPLPDGRVLLAGGTTGNTSQFATGTTAAEIFNPATGNWTPTGSMQVPRVGAPQAAVLNDGRILIAGGGTTVTTNTAEIYDPATGQFAFTGSMSVPRNGTATRLANGTVLVAGGQGVSTAEVYDPVSGTFIPTNGPMTRVRFNHTATVLDDGRVLLAGGQNNCGQLSTNTVEIYDPASKRFTPAGTMLIARAAHTATLLPDGRVLFTGGTPTNACVPAGQVDTAEIFDPITGTSVMLTDRLCSKKSQHTALALPDGRVLIAGGWAVDGQESATSCADLFDPATGAFVDLPPMNAARAEFPMVSLPDGRVLLAGGGTLPGTPVLQSAEIFGLSTATGSYVTPAAEFSTFARNLDGTFVRHYKDGSDVHFSAAGLMTSVADRNGNTTSYGYGVGGRLESMTDPKLQVWTVAYDGGGKLESITDPASRVTSFAHDSRGDLIRITKTDGASVSYAYDAQHRLTRRTDERGNDVTYAYDFSGRLVSATHPEGEVRHVAPTAVQGLVNLAGGGGTVVNPAPLTASGAVVATTTDGAGHSSFATLNRLGSPTRSEDAVGRVTQTIRDANNLPTQITRPNNSVVTMTYDTRGNLLTVTEQNDPNGPATTTFTYDPVFNQVTSIKDARNNTTNIGLDAQGNPHTITDARSKITTLTWLPGGLLQSVEDPLHHVTTYGYDALGNVDTITDPLMKMTNIESDPAGNVETVTDPKLHVTQYDYDAQNRLKEVIDAASGHTRYAYDAKGNLIGLTDARSKTTQFEYSTRDLVAKITNPLLQSRTFTYDLAGNLRFVNDPKGQQIELVYDDAHQLTARILKNASHVVTDTVTFTHGSLGTLTTATDGDSSLTFTPDPLGRVTSIVSGGTLPTTAVSYTYDKNGNRKSMTDPQGSITTYDYDEVNQLTTLTSHVGALTFGSDDAGRRQSLQYPNGMSVAVDYDAANQLTSLRFLNSAMSLLSKHDYAYDDAGDRQSRTTLDGVTTYSYDTLDRLTGAVGPDPANPLGTLTESYDYDAVGNRTASHLATGQVYDNADRLLEDSQFSYTYDLNGNLASKQDKTTSGLTTYDWDVENHLVAVHTPSQTVTFKYDPIGRRIERAGATVTRFVYDREDIIEERDGSNALAFRYVHGPGIDEPLARRDVMTSQTAFLHPDANGSITDSTDSGGQISPRYRYDSYGIALVGSAVSGHAYAGRELDADTGLVYNRARYYDPKVGRFISEDPVGLSGGMNPYAYVDGSPINRVDPLGLADSAGPWQLGWEWLTGGQKNHNFTDGDYFTELLKQHPHVADIQKGVCDGSLPPYGAPGYDLSGWQGVGKYLRDYSTLLTFGYTGNLAVTYLGSYDLTYSLSHGTIHFVVTNSSTSASAFRPPVLGYTLWWRTNVAPRINDFFSSGMMSETKQTFDFHVSCGCN